MQVTEQVEAQGDLLLEEADGGVDDLFGYNGPTQMTTRILYKPEYSSEATLAAFDGAIREVREHGISADELEQLKVKWGSDYFATLEGGRGDWQERTRVREQRAEALRKRQSEIVAVPPIALSAWCRYIPFHLASERSRIPCAPKSSG